MATKETKQHALYMVKRNDSGSFDQAELIHGEDVEDRKKDGYVAVTGQKANGELWNQEEDMAGQDAAADFARLAAKNKAEKDAKKTAELEENRKANEAALEAQRNVPDMKVQIVEPPKPAKKR